MDEETGELGADFSPQVVKAWENEFFRHKREGLRQVAVRCAIVFSGKGGAFPRYAQLVRWGLGGQHGNGQQMVSWVHEEDVAGFFEWLIEEPKALGAINLSSPGPLRQAELMRILRERIKPWIALPSPRWMLGLGARLLGTETELVLKSRWVLPTRAQELGYRFKIGTMTEAVEALVA